MYTLSLTNISEPQEPHCYMFMFNTGVTTITFLAHEEISISFMFVSFTLICGHCRYNSCLFIYNIILWAELIIPTCKNDLIFNLSPASRYKDPGR